MKRIIAFLIICLTLIGTYIFIPSDFTFDDDEIDKVCFVSNLPFTSENEEIEIIQSGSQFYITTNKQTAMETLNQLEDIAGYILYFNKDSDFNRILTKYSNFSTEKKLIGNSIVCDGYFNKYKDFQIINGKKVNVQFAQTENNIIVGFPTILTGF